MNHTTRLTNFILAPLLATLLLFSVVGFAASDPAQHEATSCSGSIQQVLFQSESTEGGETEGEGEAGDEEEGKKKEEEEEPDC